MSVWNKPCAVIKISGCRTHFTDWHSLKNYLWGQFWWKVMLMGFQIINGVVHSEFIPTTATFECHVEMLQKFEKCIQKVSPDMHISFSSKMTMQGLTECINDYKRPTRSHSLEPPITFPHLCSDFHQFPKLKQLQRGRNFLSDDKVNTVMIHQQHEWFFHDTWNYTNSEWSVWTTGVITSRSNCVKYRIKLKKSTCSFNEILLQLWQNQEPLFFKHLCGIFLQSAE